MNIDELSPYANDCGPFDAQQWISPLLAVGWIDRHSPYPIGFMDRSVSERLATLVEQARVAFPHYLHRGIYVCSLCVSAGLTPPAQPWSQERIVVPGNDAVYISPGGIVHYMQAHGYCPPPAFASASLRCPDYTSIDFWGALLRANRGEKPPLEDVDGYTSRLRKKLEATIRESRAKRSID